eukprot:jgi/Botrbrau1/11903/Bobra.0171s0013.1
MPHFRGAHKSVPPGITSPQEGRKNDLAAGDEVSHSGAKSPCEHDAEYDYVPGGSHVWQMSLRDAWSRYVPLGNRFSGLNVELTAAPPTHGPL